MDWKNAPIARVASIPGAMELSLEEVSLLAGLWKLTQKAPHKIFCWAYFESAFGLTVSKARTRLSKLERAGLMTRRMVGSRPSDALGSMIELTQMGKDLLRTLAPLLAQPSEHRVPEAPTSRPLGVSPLDATRTDGLRPAPFSSFPPAFQQGVLKLGMAAARAVKAAVESGRYVDEEEGRAVGLDKAACRALNDAIRKFAPVEQGVDFAGALSSRDLAHGDATLVEAADDAAVERAAADGLALPALAPTALSGAEPIARLVIAEAAARYRKALCGRTPGMIADRFNEIVWSCTEGPLADFGAPLKRVRVALRLLGSGRWETPIGFDPMAARRVFVAPLPALRSQ